MATFLAEGNRSKARCLSFLYLIKQLKSVQVRWKEFQEAEDNQEGQEVDVEEGERENFSLEDCNEPIGLPIDSKLRSSEQDAILHWKCDLPSSIERSRGLERSSIFHRKIKAEKFSAIFSKNTFIRGNLFQDA